jgi:hypothetical protein
MTYKISIVMLLADINQILQTTVQSIFMEQITQPRVDALRFQVFFWKALRRFHLESPFDHVDFW